MGLFGRRKSRAKKTVEITDKVVRGFCGRPSRSFLGAENSSPSGSRSARGTRAPMPSGLRR
ncbi:hypothetical protein UA75_24450 [Actinoalloteichus sp. GBA129-24]|uniref:Uncharacterized protein n=1 Tax=Actinoalloteichus fjordicus TaxID=1612552 RepID=A0AAC9PU73_9PSEU|nr:hypothetical protein UA74_23945 [Actinoalloteichus fjordicus]APU22872.1 hypothetical protein UA75_24450 [Actinoalloteichus sp. GBA129-24]